MAGVCGYSNLEESTLQRINDLEKNLGITLLAFSCDQLKTASLDPEQLKQLQSAESELGISLIAVNS